jgi:crotonobetainyl-CoA:carnitine CoA-transferase CaiB-like acyl-CoA transferase
VTVAATADRSVDAQMLLSGVRVLEVADELGEYCGKVLAGLGADVVKVEPPGGEATRDIGPFQGDQPGRERSLHFWHYNFGKRSVVLDLDDPADQALFAEIAAGADVVLETRHRDFLADRGIGAAQLRARHPGLVWSRISPFGDDGPWADFHASDLVQLALGGVMMNCGYDASPAGEYDTPPIAPQMWQAYQIAGEQTASAIVAALCYRNVTGHGQELSTSVHQAVSANTEQDTPDWVYGHQPHLRHCCGHSYPQSTEDERGAAVAAANQQTVNRTKDGRWLLPYSSYIRIQGTNVTGKGDTVDRLLDVMVEHGYTDPLLDERFADPAFRARPEFLDHLNGIISRFLARSRFSDDVWRTAQERGLAWAPVRRPEENIDDPHWGDRGTFYEVEHPGLDRPAIEVGAKWVASDGTTEGLRWRRGPRAPQLGEHTGEVLAADSPWRTGPSPVAAPAQGPSLERRRAVRASRRGTPFALAGVRIVDLSWALASAGAGRLFTALGADVLKIEHESRIDGMRRGYGRPPVGLRPERDAATGPVATTSLDSLNRGGAFMEINSGKRSVSLDLKSEDGKELLRELIRGADMVVEGFSPGTFTRMGFGYDELRRLRPDIIYVQQSGLGQLGRYGRLRTFGPTAQAFSGITDMSGLPEPFGPAGVGYSYLDWFGAYHMSTAMMAALYHRDRTGEGCWIDSSQVEVGIQLTGTAVLDHSVNGRTWQRTGNRSPHKLAAPHGAYPCAGTDRWIAVAAFTDEQWDALCGVLNSEHLRDDPRFGTLADRVANQDLLDGLVGELTAEREPFEMMATLQAAGVPAGVCQTAQDRCDHDPQLAHLGWQVELRQSEIGTWPVKEIPVHLSETPPYIGGPLDRHGPSYGEDTDSVLRDIVGLTPERIASLRRAGVVS